MSRSNALYWVVGALVIVVAVLAYQLYEANRQPDGVQIQLDKNGVSVEQK